MTIDEARTLLEQVTAKRDSPFFDNESAHIAADELAAAALRAIAADSEDGHALALVGFAVDALNALPLGSRWYA